jgi:hypothetical protein
VTERRKPSRAEYTLAKAVLAGVLGIVGWLEIRGLWLIHDGKGPPDVGWLDTYNMVAAFIGAIIGVAFLAFWACSVLSSPPPPTGKAERFDDLA